MPEIEKKALALVNEVRFEMGLTPYEACEAINTTWFKALCRAIEQHEAFRQDVSDRIEACRAAWPGSWAQFSDTLDRFIIAKPDPLVEALWELADRNLEARQAADTLRAAIEKRGGKIVWEDK